MRISEAAHLLSIPRHKIHYWKKTGLLGSTGDDLTFEDLKRLRLLESWRKNGLSLQRIRKLALRLQPDRSLMQMELLHGANLALREGTSLVDPLSQQEFLDFSGEATEEEGRVLELRSKKPDAIRTDDWSDEDDEIVRLLEERLAEEEREIEGKLVDARELQAAEEGARLFEAIRQSNPEKAVATLEGIIQDRPDYLPARIELGNLFFERGDLDSAARSYEQALELDADCVEALYNLANVYYRQEKFAASIRLFHRSIDLDPGFPESYYNLALVYYSLRYFQQSAELFESYLEMDSDSPFADNARDFLDDIHELADGDPSPGLFDGLD